jgi:hypothetical protein
MFDYFLSETAGAFYFLSFSGENEDVLLPSYCAFEFENEQQLEHYATSWYLKYFDWHSSFFHLIILSRSIVLGGCVGATQPEIWSFEVQRAA